MEIVAFCLFGGDDGGRKAAGKKTKVRRRFSGVILYPSLRLQEVQMSFSQLPSPAWIYLPRLKAVSPVERKLVA